MSSVPERLFWSDPFRSSFDARVTAARESFQQPDGAKWQIALDRTSFYPTGGGQPCDHGTIVASLPGGEHLSVPVVAVEQDENGEIWHSLSQPLPSGAALPGTLLHGEIDFARRFDHMQQHSGQHLLSAVFLLRMGAPTVSFHLGEQDVTIDLGVAHASEGDLAEVEDEANRVIAEDLSVASRFVLHSEAEALLAAGRLRKLPPRGGDIRLVEIEGVDLNACGGTHVRSTGQIGSILLRGVERVRQNVRVSFLCGSRAVYAARADFMMIHRTATIFSVKAERLGEAAERLVADQKAAMKQQQRLREQLADLQAASLITEAGAGVGLRVIRHSYQDCDREYLGLLAAKTAALAPNTCVLLATTAEQPAKMVAARSADLTVHCGTILRQHLAQFGGRGGGGPLAAQAEVPSSAIEQFLDAVEAAMKSAAVPAR